MAECYMKLEKYKEAFDILTTGLKFAPKNKLMLSLRKTALEKQKEKTDILINKFETRAEDNVKFQKGINQR